MRVRRGRSRGRSRLASERGREVVVHPGFEPGRVGLEQANRRRRRLLVLGRVVAQHEGVRRAVQVRRARRAAVRRLRAGRHIHRAQRKLAHVVILLHGCALHRHRLMFVGVARLDGSRAGHVVVSHALDQRPSDRLEPGQVVRRLPALPCEEGNVAADVNLGVPAAVLGAGALVRVSSRAAKGDIPRKVQAAVVERAGAELGDGHLVQSEVEAAIRGAIRPKEQPVRCDPGVHVPERSAV